MTKQNKIKSGDTVIVSNNGIKEIGVCKKTYIKKAIQYYNVLLERGAWLEGISDNPDNIIYVVLNKLKTYDRVE